MDPLQNFQQSKSPQFHETKIEFKNSKETIKGFFLAEKIILPDKLCDDLLSFLSEACDYQEEEVRIKPRILVFKSNNFSHFLYLHQATYIILAEDRANDTPLRKRLKSSLPFCNNGWRVCINVREDTIEYGLIRTFNGPMGFTLEEMLSNSPKADMESLGMNFVLIDVLSRFEICLQTLTARCLINFRLSQNRDKALPVSDYLDDLLCAYSGNDTEKSMSLEKAKRAYRKLLDLFSQKLHGSICFIIKQEHQLPDDIFQDGIFLKDPIDIYNVLMNELKQEQRQPCEAIISSHEKYHAYTGLLLQMLNVDGITIVDNKGRIRAYNVFVKPDVNNSIPVNGGARKRTAKYLSGLKNDNYIGVYFQSQDGMSTYERTGINGE